MKLSYRITTDDLVRTLRRLHLDVREGSLPEPGREPKDRPSRRGPSGDSAANRIGARR